MIDKNYFKVQNEFVDDIGSLSGSAVKLYMILRRAVNEGRNDNNKVFPSYKYIQGLMKTKSSNVVKKAYEELIAAGWIANIEKGNSYNHRANSYYLADRKITNNKNDGSATIILDGSTTITNTVPLPSEQLTNKTNNNKTNNNSTNKNETNLFPSSFYSEENYLGYPFNCAWLLKAMVEAEIFTAPPPIFQNDKKGARKWAAQLNNLVLLGAKEQIIEIIPRCLYNDFQIDEPAQLTERLEAHIAAGRDRREKKWNGAIKSTKLTRLKTH